MEKFTSIGQFRNVVKTITNYYNKIQSPHKIPTLTFVGTVKLHGTNAGVRRYHGKIQPQSKENILSVDSDNYGFARFISEIPEVVINNLFDSISNNPDDDITLYGEWCGKGIQDTVAICGIDKHWVLFAARVNGTFVDFYDHMDTYNHTVRIYNIWEIPYYKVVVDFKNPELASEHFERLTMEVEEECPWGRKFDISGVGEGIVWTCVERPHDSELFFKTKGAKHSKSKVKKVASVNIERVNSINALVDLVLTNGRLEQGMDILVNQMKLEVDTANMGVYMKWIATDIEKEESDTITENGFAWKDIAKTVNDRVRAFFFSKMKEF
jgi:hypothetical protein